MTLVGDSNVRTDLRETIRDRIPDAYGFSYDEDATRVRKADIVQPFERTRTTEVVSLMEFYALLQKIFESATEMDGTNYSIRTTLEFPPIDTELPCFGFKCISSGSLNIHGREEKAPRFMQEYPDPDYPGEILQEYYLRKSNIIEVTCWAKTNKIANQLVDWVDDVYLQYLWALQWCGLAHPVLWLGRGEDKTMTVREQTIHGCPLTFRVITGKIRITRKTSLRKLKMTLGITPQSSE